MPTDQDWTDVWPTAASFKASVVPLPLRMGWGGKDTSTPPAKVESFTVSLYYLYYTT